MSDREMRELQTRVKALNMFFAASSAVAESSDLASDMYRTLSGVVLKRRGFKVAPLHVFRGKKAWEEFTRAARSAEDYISSLEKDRVKKLRVRGFVCNLIVDDLLNRGRPLSGWSFTDSLHDAAGVMDRYFPLYAKSGLMPFVLKALYRGSNRKLRLPE